MTKKSTAREPSHSIMCELACAKVIPGAWSFCAPVPGLLFSPPVSPIKGFSWKTGTHPTKCQGAGDNREASMICSRLVRGGNRENISADVQSRATSSSKSADFSTSQRGSTSVRRSRGDKEAEAGSRGCARGDRSTGDHGWQKEQAERASLRMSRTNWWQGSPGPGYILNSPFCESRRICAPLRAGDAGRLPGKGKKRSAQSRRHIVANF